MDDETTEGDEQPAAVGPAAPLAPLAPAEPVTAAPPAAAPAAAAAQVSNVPMWVLGLVIMIDQVDQNIVRGVVTPLKEEFGVGDAAIGLLLSAFVLVNGLITVPAGYLADRWNRTRTIGHTVVGWSGITALTAAAPNFASLVAIRGALGFGQAITEPSCASLLADYYPAEKRGLAFSVQQVLLFVGFGLGVGLGGVVGATLGWRWAFVIVGSPGVLIAFAVYRLREPRRGHADRLHLGLASADEDGEDEKVPLFEDGFGTFMRKLVEGLRADARTILAIPTMRYALVGVSALLFTVTALGAALPQFYERELDIEKGLAEVLVGALVIMGGAPGVILGGRVADRYATRIRGARMAIPAYCILVGMSLFTLSWLHLPTPAVFTLQVLGFFVVALAVPALRAGLSDAVPANLRGAGFGFFNLASVVFGQAAAPLVVFALSGAFDDNLRTAFLIVTPPVYLGGLMLLRARDHLDADAAKIFEAILKAMQEQQAEQARERDRDR
ncbi:MAG TPA: MFS transporter [Acidimicrobiales bacterium]|nr:MFS transporter [Acidimicrobiales bacterium]